MTAFDPVPPRPSLIWFKAQAPGIRNDGSSMVTMRFAKELAKDFDLHLVCLRTPSSQADPSRACVPPFTSVTVSDTSHQRSRFHRVAFGGLYWLLDRAGVRPMAVSIEGSRTVQATVRQLAGDHDAVAGIVEYWSAGRVLDAMPQGHNTLILLDVEHAAVPPSRDSRRTLIREEELAVCRKADKVVFLSDEDQKVFADLGVDNGVTVHVPVTTMSTIQKDRAVATDVVFLGHLDWGPNQRGLDWFLEEVWPAVQLRRPDARLTVIGREDGRRDQAGVTYTGFVEDLAARLEGLDVGIVPTIDGTGVKTKTLDLLAAGLPIVSTTNGVRGTSASAGGALLSDDSEQFAELVLLLLNDPDRRARLVSEGRRALVAKHSANNLANQLLA